MKQTDVKNKILNGCQLAIERLIKQKSKTNSYLVISENGKVLKVRAKDLLKRTLPDPLVPEAKTVSHGTH